MDNTRKEKIEAIFLDMPGITEAQWNMKVFSKMSRLRLLKINNLNFTCLTVVLSNYGMGIRAHLNWKLSISATH
ncbi:hypothetical protein OIU77_001625 [Salix suchowensis]|uniref:Uncharacterized protein n=1 Tax=Salix suchowensis TaxID=1278906 RepID=A0ABQ9B458_9ROSI|nr:hypothetical protein OIU77_001625 [Salix suchowensis]